jgi:hypothetical protein
VDAGQRVEADTVPPQCPGREHPVESRLGVLGHAVLVVNFLGPVDAEADQETVLPEEDGSVVVEQRTVRLKVVLDALPGPPGRSRLLR